MSENKPKRGRPAKGPTRPLHVRISPEQKKRLGQFKKEKKWTWRDTVEHILDHFFGKPS